MTIVPPDYEPDFDKDTGWDPDDIFNRREFGQHLGNILEQANGDLVVGLYAGWGAGKSTFVKTWTKHLQNRDFPVINIDAFETDYLNDPFGCLAGETYEFIERACGHDDGMTKLFAKRCNRIWKALASAGANYIVPGAGKAVDAALGENETFGSSVENYRSQKRELSEFKNSLEIAAERLGNKEKPLVFIIDELDRCRPTYALQMLERIKHLFSVPNVVFVLVMNKKQMENSVCLSYGTDETEAATYLNKFIHLPINLQMDGEKLDKREYTRYLLDKMGYQPQEAGEGFPPEYETVSNSFVNFMCDFFKRTDSSLREIQRILTLFMLTKHAAGREPNLKYREPIALILSYLRITDKLPNEYIIKGVNSASVKFISSLEQNNTFNQILSHIDLKALCSPKETFDNYLENQYQQSTSMGDIWEHQMIQQQITPKQLRQYHFDLLNTGNGQD